MTKKANTPKELSYQQALEELQQLLQNLENGELDIDRMTADVKQASELIKYCKEKLFTIEHEINAVLDKLDGE